MRRRGPGLVGMAARTAVVAGTATAASGRVARRQAKKFDAEQAGAAASPEGVEGVEGAEEAPAAAAPEMQDDTVAQLQQLAGLHDQGILTDEEFTAKKQQILGI